MVLKATASAISIGSGFRGGLFFASLFLGALLGKAFAGALALVSAAHAVPQDVCALVGMSAATPGGQLHQFQMHMALTHHWRAMLLLIERRPAQQKHEEGARFTRSGNHIGREKVLDR